MWWRRNFPCFVRGQNEEREGESVRENHTSQEEWQKLRWRWNGGGAASGEQREMGRRLGDESLWSLLGRRRVTGESTQDEKLREAYTLFPNNGLLALISNFYGRDFRATWIDSLSRDRF
jgi:hypothetical protein